jgi:hypothetical protein
VARQRIAILHIGLERDDVTQSTGKRPLRVTVLALGQILFGVAVPLWVLGSEAGNSSQSAMSELYVLDSMMLKLLSSA